MAALSTMQAPQANDGFARLAASLAELGRAAHARGWAFGTSGNFSGVLSREPLRVAITASGVDKGLLTAEQILAIDDQALVAGGAGRPSAEARVHLAIVGARGAGAVVHTHSVWSTLLSDACAGEGGLAIEGYEMLKGLRGVTTHEHREWLPILENTQDWEAGASSVLEALVGYPDAHGFLIRRHGLYTWGEDLPEARRHLEILEFLLEVVGRLRFAGAPA
jgi:methylthioribulose-1-phosphate dehydratase